MALKDAPAATSAMHHAAMQRAKICSYNGGKSGLNVSVRHTMFKATQGSSFYSCCTEIARIWRCACDDSNLLDRRAAILPLK